MKLYDLHVHTNESSACCHIDAKDVVRLYKNAGYSGIVITDHCIPSYVNNYKNVGEMLEKQVEGYYAALQAAKDIDLEVYYGCEFRFSEANQTDYLVYGAEPDYFIKHDNLMYMPISEGLKSIRADGLKVFQAHPFRNNMRVTDPGLLDGIEIHNGHYDHNSRNEFAYMWAKHYGLTGISGSDFHEIEDLARGGIICGDDVCSYEALINCIINNEYKLIFSC